jgi:flagellar hook-length control protein FliK
MSSLVSAGPLNSQAPFIAPAAENAAHDTPAVAAQAAPEQTQALLAVRLARAVQQGQTTLSVELHPAELGRVEVHLSFRPDGVGVQMTVDRQDTFDAFVRDRGSLEQQLAQAGIDLGSSGLDLRFGQHSSQPSPRENLATTRLTAVMPVPAPSSRPVLAVQDGRVDIVA